MKKLVGACIVGQSGGPTAVINASVQGVVETAMRSDCITRVLGAAYGIKGVLDDKLYDMGKEFSCRRTWLQRSSSEKGSKRRKLIFYS